MKRNLSIAVKSGLVYMTVLLLSCLFLGFLLFRSSSSLIKTYMFNEVESNLEHLGLEFQDYISDIKNDVLFISQHPFLQNQDLSEIDDEKIQILSREFLNLLDKKEHYSQIRLIGVDNSGLELIRTERSGNKISLVEKSDLQKKGQRDYFRHTRQLSKGGIYFSKIDLNKEFGKISQPATPTLRAAVPIYNLNEFQGIVIINLNLNPFFNRISNFASNDKRLFLFSTEKDFLMHPDSSLTFGFEYGRMELAMPFDDVLREKKSEESYLPDIYPESLYYFWKEWSYPRQDFGLVCSLGISASDILVPIEEWRKKSLIYIALIIAFASLLGGWFLRNQVLQFGKITELMKFPTTPSSIDNLPTNRNDEIGEMARSFKAMYSQIDQSIANIELEKKAAIHARNEKEVFIENMSHELRNPLQNILGMTEVLEGNQPRPDQQPVLNSIKFSSRHLKSLLNDVLDYKLLKENKIKLFPIPVRLSDLAAQIVRSHNYQAQMKNMTIELYVNEVLDKKYVKLDEIRLTQVINNLLSNAIKYGFKDSVIKFNIELNEEEPQSLLFSIEDQGIGVDHKHIAYIQDRFQRGDSSEVNKTEGVGLGLAVVTQILDLYDTQLHIQSQKNLGSIFSFKLPYHPVKNTLKEYLTLPQSIHQILIIEDDPLIVDFYKESLNSDFSILEIIDEALQWQDWIHSDGTYDLIIADNQFYDLKMIENAAELNRRLSVSGVLLYTSGEKISSLHKVSSIVKPIGKQELLKKIFEDWKRHLDSPPKYDSLNFDYDNDSEKLKKVYGLMNDQWEEMSHKILASWRKEDHVEAQKIFHKMTTTLKRLDLLALNHSLSNVIRTNAPLTKLEIDVYQYIFQQIGISISGQL